MFCRVVPITRTPPGVEYFDYRIPESLHVQAGDLVVVPFRRGKLPALVLSTMSTSPFAHKAQDVLSLFGGIRFPIHLLELLAHTSAVTFTSKPAVLKSWLRSLPKRIPSKPESLSLPTFLLQKNSRDTSAETRIQISAHWDLDHESKLLAQAQASLAQGKRVLILTPWKARLAYFQNALLRGAIYSSDLNDGDAFRAWSGFYWGTEPCIISTRLGAWLAPLADIVYIDEPENDDHKQDELAPRYDARKLAIWAAEHAATIVEAHGLTPPLHSDEPAPSIPVDVHVMIRHPRGKSVIPMIQGEALNLLRDHDGPRVIVHPIKGDISRLTCRDCGHKITCSECKFTMSAEGPYAICRRCNHRNDLPLSCPTCGGIDLGKSLPGIERLKSAWAKHETDTPVLWRGISNQDMELPIPAGAALLITDGVLIAGGSEDVRRMEKLAVRFRNIARDVLQAGGTLIVQTDETMAAFWTQILTTEGFHEHRLQERAARSLFQYPPAKRLIKAILEHDDTRALQALEPLAQIRGPFPIPHQVRTRKIRYIWHILPPTNQLHPALFSALTQLSKQALIDLDPIAFLR